MVRPEMIIRGIIPSDSEIFLLRPDAFPIKIVRPWMVADTENLSEATFEMICLLRWHQGAVGVIAGSSNNTSFSRDPHEHNTSRTPCCID